jgi:hypothetical protein
MTTMMTKTIDGQHRAPCPNNSNNTLPARPCASGDEGTNERKCISASLRAECERDTKRAIALGRMLDRLMTGPPDAA